MATFNRIFKDIYTEVLKEQGFKYNSKYGYFFRIINNELIQYITNIKLSGLGKGVKCFNVFAGIVSIYSESVDKDFLRTVGSGLGTYTKIPSDKIGMYYTEEQVPQLINESLVKTLKYIIPLFNEVVDLNTYIAFRKKINGLMEIKGADVFWADSLALIMSDNHDDFNDVFQEKMNIVKEQIQLKKIGTTYEEEYKSWSVAIFTNIVEARDKVYQDKQLYSKAITEAERRKCANLEYLRSMKVID